MSEQETGAENNDRNWAQARAKIDKLEAENTKLRELALAGIAHQAGFDTSNGVTKLLLEKYTGTVEDLESLSTDSFSTFAKEWGVEPNLATAPTEEPEVQQDRTAEDQMEQLQNRADVLGREVSPPEPPTIDDRIAEAEANGDVASAIALKLNPLLQPAD